MYLISTIQEAPGDDLSGGFLVFGETFYRELRIRCYVSKRAVLTVGQPLPVRPDQRTFAAYVGTSKSRRQSRSHDPDRMVCLMRSSSSDGIMLM
jgi:hypothetical protein